jgi:ribosomal protein S18 acetylase RimI-like enzyme
VHAPLANPMWSALCTTHAAHAQSGGLLKRFMPDVAPFCAVEHDGVEIGAPGILLPGEDIFFLGTLPALPAGCALVYEAQVLQMVVDGAPALRPAGGPDAPLLDESALAAMLALTALVYPEFFRPRTRVLGNYIGVHEHGELVAMAGQRLACPGYREISAVCTHPDHRGQGHAARLIGRLARSILADGDVPFLHVSASNRRAWALYENLGFKASRELRFQKLRVGA